METPSFTFRLERVRDLRERAEERAQEELARELRLRLDGAAALEAATDAASAARDAGRDAVLGDRVSSAHLLAVQAYLERSERTRVEAALDLDRRDAEVSARRETLAAASRERQVIDRLKERRRADHDREWERRAQSALDEVALAVHRRGGAAAA